MLCNFGRRTFIKAVAGAACAGPTRATAAPPPNGVFIYADDLGYGDLGSYGSRIRTPNLDRMAAEGVRFTQFYCANPVCSPSRAALLTGRYPTRVNVPRVLFPTDTTGLAEGETTIAQMLSKRGYRTMCIGKWHLGHLPPHLPTSHGFDEYFGIPYSNDMSPRVLMHNAEVIENPVALDTLTPRYTQQALRFIAESKNRPFFLYMPHTYPHIPLAASARFRGKSPLGLYGDVIEELDWSVGEVLARLKKNGLDQNTIVMFSSDNGPWYQGSPGRLRGRKGSTYEGGVREPFIARFPGRIPKGTVSRGVAWTIDILPTLARLCSAPLPERPLDGIDIWPLLTVAAFCYALLPQRPAFRIGIDGVHHARFLTQNQRALVSSQVDQQRWRAKIEIGPVRIGAVQFAGLPARQIHRVGGGELARPKESTRIEIEGQHGVAGSGDRVRIIVAGGDVKRVALGIDERSRPHCSTRRPDGRRAALCLHLFHGRLGDGVRLPQYAPARCIEGQHAAAKGAAQVPRL